LYWIKYFIIFHQKRHPETMGPFEVEQFLTHLAVTRKVSASTQKIALNALAFLYNKVLEQPLGDLGEFNRAKTPAKLPVVLTRHEMTQILSRMTGSSQLMASLLYGSGLRRNEAVRLRVKDIDFDHHQLQVWNGKGNYHRLTTLAPELVPRLTSQIEQVRLFLQEDSQLQQQQVCGCRLPWPANTAWPRARWAGNTCSLRQDSLLIRMEDSCVGII
jgi:integrase